MTTEIDVINMALIRLGEKPITSLSDQRKAARIASATFDEHRDFVTQDHAWNFATRFVELAASATAPDFGFQRAFPINPEHLRVVEMYDEPDADWEVQQHLGARAILTDLTAPLKARIIFQVTDLSITTPMYRDALAQYCASQWAEAMTGSLDRKSEMLAEYTLKVTTARSNDGREGTLPKGHIRHSWLDDR